MRVLQINILLLILLSVQARKKNVNCSKLQRKCDKGREHACRKIRKHCPPTVTEGQNVEENLSPEVVFSPGKPTQIEVNAFPTRLEIAWSPPTSNAPVEGYILGYGRGIPDIYTVTLGPDTFNYVITDLEPKKLYVISVRAFNYNSLGPSIYETAVTIKEPKLGPCDRTTAATPVGSQNPMGGQDDPSHQELEVNVSEDDGELQAGELPSQETTDRPI